MFETQHIINIAVLFALTHLVAMLIGFYMGKQAAKTRFIQGVPIYPGKGDFKGYDPGANDTPNEDPYKDAMQDPVERRTDTITGEGL